MSTHNKRYPTIISIMPPGMALIVTLCGSNYRCLEQIFMVPKGFEPSKFNCILKILPPKTDKNSDIFHISAYVS